MSACAQPDAVRHPYFARVYVRAAAEADKRGQREHRAELLRGLAGRVVEVGAGHGLNFRHYPAGVTEVIAVEPEAYLREIAGTTAESVPVPVRIVDGVASQLPLDDGSVDAGVASLVLCSVTDQARALAELHRVIRPGGVLHFYEHVRAPTRPRAWLQVLVDHTFWPWMSGGCHSSRDTLTAIEHAGFRVQSFRRLTFSFSPLFPWTAPHVLGIARRG